jgi:hypothetical protein
MKDFRESSDKHGQYMNLPSEVLETIDDSNENLALISKLSPFQRQMYHFFEEPVGIWV